MRARFQLTPGHLDALADALGTNAARLGADIGGVAVEEAPLRSRAVARAFGFVGAPARVVGRTVVQGEIGEGTRRRPVDRERADGPVPGSAAAT